MTTKYIVRLAIPRPPYEFRTVYEELGGGSFNCGDDPHKYLFFDTYKQALDYSEYINKQYFYVTEVEEYVS